MKINKKSIVAAALAVLMASETAYAVHIPDHRGTDISAFSNGTKTLSSRIPQYDELFKAYGDQYGIDPNILAAICMQESSGINYSYRDDGTPYAAWGIMQIEYTHEKSFSQFGLSCTWLTAALFSRGVSPCSRIIFSISFSVATHCISPVQRFRMYIPHSFICG